MRNTGSKATGHRRILSFVSYAFSSIVFDMVAYVMSGKLYGMFNVRASLLSPYPAMAYSILHDEMFSVETLGYNPFSLTALLIILPLITFVGGIMLHRIFSRKSGNSRVFSEKMTQLDRY